jgi:ribonuclease G
MSKELIVSATRHETRVAVLEDDQVVEIFHQREKEYSLAGSIHKGRVTRVLPGMQSAFVDIGLERDAFLYVSDFFEDNDEYDKIVSTVEDKVLRLEKEGSSAVLAEGAVAAVNGQAAAETAPAAIPQRREERPERGTGDRGPDRGGDRDRGGRGGRGRRRRGGGGGGGRGPQSPGGGIPDSKYFSPRQQTAEPSQAAEPVGEEEETLESAAEDLIVLPGESLAKYTGEHREEFASGETEPAEVEAAELEDDALEELDSVPEPEMVVLVQEPGPVEFEPFIISVEHSSVAAEPATPEPVPVEEQPAAASEPRVESTRFESESATVEAADEVPSSEAVGETNPDEVEDEEVEAAIEEEISEGSPVEPEGPEPARIPTSLTATLREQGPRFQHRVSRRVRRKMRGGPPDGRPQNESRGDQPRPSEARAPESTNEPRREVRSEVRAESRGESADIPRVARPVLPSISDLLREGQEIIVQIAKEPLGQKGARITSHVALPGRFLVYMPSVDHVGVSRKIPSDEERLRLKRILQTHRTGIPGGFIVRTAGEGRSEEELKADMMFLANLWTDMRQNVERKPAPQLMHHDLDVVQRILRDQLTSSFKTVWVDNEELYESVLRFVQRFQPAMVSRTKLYTRPAPIFDEFGITAELEKALRPKVWLKSGGYIVINQTEALVAIDINTGKYVGKSNRLEDTIVKTNTDAVKEIVRQIRLRDLGGIIVVDFIDMDERKNRQKVMQALEEAMRADRAPYKILQFNDFGLVAITRKRVKQSLERTLCAPCPYCEGAGYIKSVQTVVGEILVEASKMSKALVDETNVVLRVNPEVAKVLKSNANDFLQEIEEVLGKSVIVKSDPLLHQTKFDLA